MRSNYDRAFKLLIESEGGYVNDSADRGGETNLGVTRRAWGEYLKRSILDDEMKRLTPADVKLFYKLRYWDAVAADALPDGVDYVVFDFSVNAGPRQAAKYLQRSVGVVDDGIIGPQTLRAVQAMRPSDLIQVYTDWKERFYQGLVTRDQTQAQFLNGWLNRCARVESDATAMA